MDSIADNQSGAEKTPPLKLLVVDDDALNQRMMKVLLTREGHQVELASNGLEALEAVKLQKFDIVFMDLRMPVMDGLEASRRIREWENGGQHTFIVALTASFLPDEGHILFDAGIDNYVSKPFEMEHIQRLLKYSSNARLSATSPQQPIVEPAPASNEILDVQKGIEQVGGDPEIYRELLSEFVDELPERLQIMQRYFAGMNLTELSRVAHNLKGIAANLGALQLSNYAGRLDEQSNGGYTESVADLLREIPRIQSKFMEISNNFLADRKPSAI
jgi:CheY-like chemotaxis protein/HPt (histidine-containing phosphotransfer) domain-containing protein